MSALDSISLTLKRLRHLIFGYDFFISYAHGDGKEYAVRLERALVGMDFAIFRDESEMSGGVQLSLVIRWTIRRTRCVLVLGTRNGITSRWVADEVKMFKARRRRVVPIDIHGVRDLQPWFAQDEIIFMIDPRGDQGPSDSVIQEITVGRGRWRVHRLARWAMGLAIAVLLALTAAAIIQRNQAVTNEHTAQRNFRTARARELASASVAALDAAPQRAILLALEATAATHVDGTTDPEADRALRAAVAAVGGVPIGRKGPVAATAAGAISWDGEVVVWWSLDSRRPTQRARVRVEGLGANGEYVSLKALADGRALVESFSRVVVVAPGGAITELVPRGENNSDVTVLADGTTLFVRTCRGCPDFAAELRKRGSLSAEDLARFPSGDYRTTAWILTREPSAKPVPNDPYGYGELKTPCGALLVVPESGGAVTLRRWTGEALVTIAEPDPREGRNSAWATSPDCSRWISGSALGMVRVWRTDQPAASSVVTPPSSRSFARSRSSARTSLQFLEVRVAAVKEASLPPGVHASGITALGFVGANYLVIGQADGTADLRAITSAGVGVVAESVKHGGSVTGFAASADSGSFATWSSGGDLNIRGGIAISDGESTSPFVWSIGSSVHVQPVPERWTQRVEFASDRRWLAIESRPATSAQRVSLWRMFEEGPPRAIQITEDANHAQFTNLGRALLVAQASGTLQRMTLSANSVTRTTALRWHESAIESLTESFDGTRIVSIDDQKHAALWKFDSVGSLVAPSASHVSFHHPDGAIESAVAADDGRWMAALGKHGQVVVGTLRGGENLSMSTIGSSWVINDRAEYAMHLAADPSGDKVAIVMQTKSVPTGNLGPTRIDIVDVSRLDTPSRFTLAEQPEGITSIGMVGKGGWLWTRLTDVNDCLMMFGFKPGCPRERFWMLDRPGPRAADRELSNPEIFVNRETARILTSDTIDGPVSLLALDGPQIASTQLPVGHLGEHAGTDPTGKWAVVYGKSESGHAVAGLVSLGEPSRFFPFEGPDDSNTVYTVSWAQNGTRVAMKFFSGTAVIDTSGSEPVHMGVLQDRGTASLAPDGSWAVFSDGSCFARLSRGQPLRCTALNSEDSAVIGGDSTWFVAGYEDGVVRLWNTQGSNPTSRVISQFGATTTPIVKASGSIFAIAALGKLEAWRVEKGQTSRLWEETLSSPIQSLSVTRSGVIWATTSDGDLHLWSEVPKDLNAAARAVLGRGFTPEERDRWLIRDSIPGFDTWWR